jgi:aspartate-semialdehyde dehydrogenase
MTTKRRIGILGATGLVGQRLAHMLRDHPTFEISAVAASDRSVGRPYGEACPWRLPVEMPASVARLRVEPCEPPLDCDLVVSSLPTAAALEAEPAFAAAGYPVVSNSSALRMDDDVPLVVPEANADHLALVDAQRRRRGFDRGFVVTNPNCSTIALVLALAPLDARFGLDAVMVTTMQAISGAGYPGVASIDVVDNVIPHIGGEEEKVENEPQKILGALEGDRVRPAAFAVSAQCNRVAVHEGHLASVRIRFKERPSVAEVADALAAFRGVPQELGLPSAPARPVVVRTEADRPQPRLDRDAEAGMATVVGRIAPDTIFDVKLTLLGNNMVRGAAGAAILNAELLAARGLL